MFSWFQQTARPGHARAQWSAALSAGACVLAVGLLLACGDDDGAREEPEMKAGSANRGDAGLQAATDAGVDASTASGATRDGGSDAAIVLVGEVGDSDIRLGAVIAADRMRLFFCGGPSSYATATHWLQVELDAGPGFAFQNDALALQGELDGERLEGELTRAGEPALRFNAERVRAGTLAGLYEAQAECGRVGLIIAQRSESDPPAAQGACVGPGHVPEQVNPILPLALDQNGTIAVEVEREGSLEAARVQRAAPPRD
jgi:hypothetical protein